MVDNRLIGSILIMGGLIIAGFGGTMSTWQVALFYIIGFLIAFAGLGLLLKDYRSRKGEL
ncbi:MAG: hypothetical protein EAX86_07740 [Candidatus Heimdallarchaeota archaeon]|nr:hypothetical protein [Candidatus Heimdallarchaeota archaeon]